MVRNFCAKCKICIKNKSHRPKPSEQLGLLGPANKPFETIPLDTIGGFVGKRSTKRYLHLLVKHFTHFALICTSKGQTASIIIKLVRYIQRKHPIGILLADQQGGLNSQEFNYFVNKEEIYYIFTTIDYSSSNHLNERLNQTLSKSESMQD